MFVSAKELAMICHCSPKTILAHVNRLERDGYRLRAKIGKPTMINREMFMILVYPGWREEDEHEREGVRMVNACGGTYPFGIVRSGRDQSDQL